MDIRIKEILKTPATGQEIRVKGWVRSKRDSKAVCFLAINDGSCMSNIQVIIDKESANNGVLNSINRLNTGASCNILGKLVESQGQGQSVEVQALEVEVLGEAPEDYPLQKKRHSFEFLREIAHLRPRTNTFAAVARVRNSMSFAIHKYFQENGFLYVNTPIITESDAEGAGEMFQVTTVPLDKLNGGVDYSRDFFGKKASLTVSGQLCGETYATALGNIYTFGPTFRAENSNTTKHLAEFWMIEPEMAFCDINMNIDIAEDFLKYILKYVLENCQEDMEFFDQHIEKGVIDKLKGVINTEFTRITYTDGIKILEESKKDFQFPVKWGIDLQTEHEKYLTEHFGGPVAVVDYPKDIKAFYMKLNADGKTVRGVDILVPRLGEIIGGSQREDDYDILVQKIKEVGLKPEEYSWYLDTRKYGSVPHSGFGLGFARLIMYVTGMENIRDVIPFPRTTKNLRF
ncbi:MAG: asparagine--tRNA ligase [Spirochaetales bacterium]|nr:asparagine--tRNA ligase [Spirochaetales bacterium]